MLKKAARKSRFFDVDLAVQASCRSICMIRILISTVVVLLLSSAVSAQKEPVAASQLKVGDAAPNFTLSDTTGQKVNLSDFRGKHNVVLAFYVFAFTGG